MSLSDAAMLVTELGVLIGVLVPVVTAIRRIMNGQRCTLRSEMLRSYYRHKDSEQIRQYEYENFVFLYQAYKSLGGNSFIDKIYEEVKTWEVIS